MTTLKEINHYLSSIHFDHQSLKEKLPLSVYLSLLIAIYAHRNQKRVNGEHYIFHPYRCLMSYRKMIGLNENNFKQFNSQLVIHHHLPYDGVQESCLLHDVLEDTNITLNDLKQIFKQFQLDDYFQSYIEQPLLLITHDKTMPYYDYIQICMKNPISAIAKFFDLEDNLTLSTLNHFHKKNYFRAQNYLTYAYTINAKFHFIENAKRISL